AISLQAEELDLPSRPPPPPPPPPPLLVAADVLERDAAVCATAACTIAAGAAAPPWAPKLHTAVVEGLTSIAAVAAAAATDEPSADDFAKGGYVCEPEGIYLTGKAEDERRGATGNAATKSRKRDYHGAGDDRARGRVDDNRDDEGEGEGDNELRVANFNLFSACPRSDSVPVLAGQCGGAATTSIGLRRTASVALSTKARGNGGGASAAAGEDDYGGDGGRTTVSATGSSGSRPQFRPRTRGRVSGASIRSLFAQGKVVSPLNSWGRSQWELATANGLEAEPLQVDPGCAAAPGRTRGISTSTAVAIPEDSPFLDPLPGPSHAPLAAGNNVPSNYIPPPSLSPATIAVDIFQLPCRRNRELMEGLLVDIAVASGASGGLNSAAVASSVSGGSNSAAAAAAAAIVRPCPGLIRSYGTSSAIHSSTCALPPLVEEMSYGSAADEAEKGTFPAGSSGLDGADDGASHVMLPDLDTGGNSGPPPLPGSEAQVSSSMGSPRAGAFVLKIMSIIGVDAGNALPPSTSVAISAAAAGGTADGGTSAAAVVHRGSPAAPEPAAAELAPKSSGLGEGAKGDPYVINNAKENSRQCYE
ncbi:hypothetical protein Vretimale_4018, partial [Volvox reticuliferus]